MRRALVAAATSLSIIASGLVIAAAPASATNTAPTAATYGANAAVDVTRSPGYPFCAGSTYNQWSVTSTGNPISQGVHNVTGNTTTSRVDLSSVSYWNGTTDQATPALLKITEIAPGTPGSVPATFSLKMYIAPGGTTELLWNTARSTWATSGAGGGTISFASTGNAYAVYSGGFLHEGVKSGSGIYDIGTFLMIDDTLTTGTRLVYTPSPGTDNTCISSRTYATATGMASRSLGGSGVKNPGSAVDVPPTIRLDINGNGGVCTPSFVEGVQGTWGTAPTADKCTNGTRQLAFFSTSPTAALGATNVAPGGPVYFLAANLLYAIWAPEKPSPVTDVVATSGLNSVKVTWKAPVSDGGDPINSYCVALRTEQNPNPFPRCSSAAEPLERTVNLPATNSKYTFTVFARNFGGSSELVASAPVSPYDIRGVTASRKDVLLGLGGTQVEARGDAPGLAGQSLNVEYKVGAGQWTTQANAVSVDAKSNFRWSKKFPRSSNKNAVTVRFTYGADAVAGPFVLKRGGVAGDLSAPRNIKVENAVNRVIVTWDPPKFDGGEKITGYTMCAIGNGSLCRNVSAEGRAIFQNLATGRDYTITVAAKTATRTGPAAEAKQKVSPVEASVRITSRDGERIGVASQVAGFKKGARFRLEFAVAVPGELASAWRWVAFPNTIADGNVNRGFVLPSTAVNETIAVRLVTPNGPAYSRLNRP